jgi:uncharacterized iron-regulated membrane protein
MRKLAYKLHKWIGLTLLALVFVQAMTGIIIAYRWDLARMIDPQGMTSHGYASPATLDGIVAAARGAIEQAEPVRMMFPDRARATYFVHLKRPDGGMFYASIDAGSASVLRAGGLSAFPTELAFEIHHALMAGTAGSVIVGLDGALLCVLLAAGLVLWLPRNGGLGRALRIQLRSSPQRAALDLHRVPGAIALIPMLSIVAAGTFIALQPVLATRAPATEKQTAMTAAAQTWSLEQSVEQARKIYPQNFLREVRWPGDGTVWVLFRAPEVSARAVHIVVVEPSAGRVAEVRPAATHAGPTTYVLPFHTGEEFGAVGRLVTMIVGVVLLSMSVTGLVIWVQRRGARQKMRRNALAAQGRA